MSKLKYFFLVNSILFGNITANMIGDFIADTFLKYRVSEISEGVLSQLGHLDDAYSIFCILIMSFITIWYERPIRKCLKLFSKNKTPEPELLVSAKRRLLNEPYVIVALDAFVWVFGSILFTFAGAPGGISIASGLITVMIAFFWVENISQHNLSPIFFPHGDLSTIKGAKSISLKVRLSALVFAVSIVPLAFIHLTIHQFRMVQDNSDISPLVLSNKLQETIAVESAVFMAIGIFISILVWHNLKKPVTEIIRVMKQVKKGDMDAKAIIYTNDEIGFAGETLNAMTTGLKEREKIKDTFGRYVSPKIRDEILKGNIPLDGELKEATILFADLRNFTPLVELTPPKELIHLLNDYLNSMSMTIKAHGGLVLQYIGDEIEAVFGAPIHDPDHVKAAVRAAIEMRKQLGRINQSHIDDGFASLSHGIGIHTGQVLAANIGSSNRTAYSLIGDTVNTASRIQDLNKKFGTDILVSAKIAEQLDQEFDLNPLPEIRVKGKARPIKVFSIP